MMQPSDSRCRYRARRSIPPGSQLFPARRRPVFSCPAGLHQEVVTVKNFVKMGALAALAVFGLSGPLSDPDAALEV
jgi:hypothetical protein